MVDTDAINGLKTAIGIDDNTPVYSPRFFVCGMIARFRYAE